MIITSLLKTKLFTRCYSNSQKLIVSDIAIQILNTEDPKTKTRLTQDTFEAISKNNNTQLDITTLPQIIPNEPARPKLPVLVNPRDMPNAKKLGVASHIWLLHSLAHIELNAVELGWDTMLRALSNNLPVQFYIDWIKIVSDEARHFDLLCDRLIAHNSYYGFIPAHNNLWNIAIQTQDNLLARIATIQLVQEPRALDSSDRLQKKFQSLNDGASMKLMNTICQEEILHVKLGFQWFDYLCNTKQLNPLTTFHDIASKYVGYVPPPFNEQARHEAGMSPDWYLPLANKKKE